MVWKKLPWVVCFIWSAVASAQMPEVDLSADRPSSGQGWSVLAGKSLGAGQTALVGQVGWPGVAFAVLRGIDDTFDAGGRLTLNYAYEGFLGEPRLGLRMQAVLRMMLLESGRLTLGLKLEPGLLMYSQFNVWEAALALPVGFALGISAGSAVVVNLGLDLPAFIVFGPGGGLRLPFQVGAGAEYFLEQDLSVSFNARMGPAIVSPYFTPFALQVLLGVAYRLG